MTDAFGQTESGAGGAGGGGGLSAAAVGVIIAQSLQGNVSIADTAPPSGNLKRLLVFDDDDGLRVKRSRITDDEGVPFTTIDADLDVQGSIQGTSDLTVAQIQTEDIVTPTDSQTGDPLPLSVTCSNLQLNGNLDVKSSGATGGQVFADAMSLTGAITGDTLTLTGDLSTTGNINLNYTSVFQGGLIQCQSIASALGGAVNVQSDLKMDGLGVKKDITNAASVQADTLSGNTINSDQYLAKTNPTGAIYAPYGVDTATLNANNITVSSITTTGVSAATVIGDTVEGDVFTRKTNPALAIDVPAGVDAGNGAITTTGNGVFGSISGDFIESDEFRSKAVPTGPINVPFGVDTADLNAVTLFGGAITVIQSLSDFVDVALAPPVIAGTGNPLRLPGGVYLIVGEIEMGDQPIVFEGDFILKGYGRDGSARSAIKFALGDPYSEAPNISVPCISTGTAIPGGHNYQLQDIYFEANKSGPANQTGPLIYAADASSTKFGTITNCRFGNTNTVEVFEVIGYDLTDFNQSIFMYNYPATAELRVTNGSKLQVSSCEFLRQFQEGSSPVVYGTASAIKLITSIAAVNITSCFFHPQVTQRGIDLELLTGSPNFELLISGCTFIPNNLNDPANDFIKYNQDSVDNHPQAVVEGNTGVENQKALVNGGYGSSPSDPDVSIATVAGSYVAVAAAGFANTSIRRFTENVNSSLVTYTGKKPIYCLITANVTASHATSGQSNTLLFANEIIRTIPDVNNPGQTVDDSTFTTPVKVEIENNVFKSFSYTTTVELQQGDDLQFVVQNPTAGADPDGVVLRSVNASLIEI